MAVVTPVEQDPILKRIDDFEEARANLAPQARLDAIRTSARRFHEELMNSEPVLYYRAINLIKAPYPTRYGLRDACPLPTPFIHIRNRMFVVQFKTEEGVKTMLVSPSDIEGNGETPFFKRLATKYGPLSPIINNLLAVRENTVEEALHKIGLKPEQVDYITYDHLHTQDIRKWLGTNGQPGYFPNAKLLIMRQEWDSTLSLAPPQRDWYCPHGIDGVPEDRIVMLDDDVMVGEGVALLRTPGHTEGNHSIVIRTPEGVFVTSENGVGADAYAPHRSGIPGIRKYAEDTGQEVILNSNTLERGLDQYISMVQEKEVAGKSQRNSDFYNVFCSSELTGYWMFPGIKPTFYFGETEFGELQPAGSQ